MSRSNRLRPYFSAVLLIAVSVCGPLLFAPNIVRAKDELTIEALSRLRGGVREHVLPNGLKILFYERKVAPIFSGVVSIRVGGVNERVGKTGASHLFEHLAFKGTPEIGTSDYAREGPLLQELEQLKKHKESKGSLSEKASARLLEINRELDEIWKIAEFTNLYRKWGESGMNATTAKELTNYFSSFPKTSFEFWCWIESQRLTRPVARQFYKERDVVLEERRARYENSPSGKLYERLLGQAFLQHPYRNPVIGYEADIRGLHPTDVLALHKEYYVAPNIVVSVVGDLSFEEALPTLQRYFGRVAAGTRPQQPSTPELPQEGERRFSVSHDAEPVFFVGYRKPVFPDPREPALTLFLENALGSQVAPLYRELVLRKKMVSSLGYFEAPGDSFPNLAVVYAEPIKPYTNQQVLAEFDRGMAELLKVAPSEKDIATAKRVIMKSAMMGMKSNMGLASELADIEQKFGSWKVLLDWYEQLLEVTPEEVLQAGTEILKPSNRTVGFLSRDGELS